jgi:hypothetical protein
MTVEMVREEETGSVSWTVFGLLLEASSPRADRFWVTVRHVGSAPVVWDGEFAARGRALADLPADDFTLEVLSRAVQDQSDRLGRFVYAQDTLREALREFRAAMPETFRH